MTRTVRMLFPRGQPTSGDITSGNTQFKANGQLTGSSYSGPTNWFKPTAGGVGAGYWLRLTRLSGTSGVTFGAFQDVWTSLISDRTVSAAGSAGSCSGVWEIASDSAGAHVVGSGNISVNNTL